MSVRFGAHRIELELVASTNDYAWDLLAARPSGGSAPRSLPEGTLVWAYHQYVGRGQRGTHWHADPGENLTCSLILYPAWLAPEDLFRLQQALALGVYHGLKALAPELQLAVKWPNDLMAVGHKLGGLLLENHLTGQRIDACVLGVGLNVNQTDFEPPLAGLTTSLAQLLGRRLPITQVLDHVLPALEAEYRALQMCQPADYGALNGRYEALLYGRGQQRSFQLPDSTVIEGIISGVTATGRLALAMLTPHGAGMETRTFGLKEIRFL